MRQGKIIGLIGYTILMVFCCLPVKAQQDGSTCEKAIPVGAGFSQLSYAPGEYWFTAGTYDLPIEVTYVPTNQTNPVAPKAYLDFTCDGTYDEDIAVIIGKYSQQVSVTLPVEMTLTPITLAGNIKAFHIAVSENYRNLLAQGGISRNVQAMVRVVITEPGGVDIQPDTISQSCMNNSHLIAVPETLAIAANDYQTVYISPFNTWRNDSVRYTWNGAADAQLWLAKDTCSFSPSASDPNVLTHYTLPANGYYTFSKAAINTLVNTYQAGGMYYTKVVSSQAGQLMVDRVPEAPPVGIALEYDVAATVRENENNAYYFSKDWTATHFSVPTTADCRIYFGTSTNIDPNNASTYFASYALDTNALGQHYIDLSDKEIEAMAAEVGSDKNYIYCKIITNEATTVTPTVWNVDACMKKSILLRAGDTITLGISQTVGDVVVRMKWNEWKNYDITVNRKKNSAKLQVGMTTNCGLSTLNKTNCTQYKEMATTVATWSIPQSTLATISNPDNGYYYWLFNNNRKLCKVWFTASTPAPSQYTLTVVPSPTAGGTVSGGGKYTAGTKVTITSSANHCYEFTGWNDGNINPSREVTVNGNSTYTANFTLQTFSVSAQLDKPGGGTVDISEQE